MSALKNRIEYLCKNEVRGNPVFKWYRENLCYVEYKEIGIAFDIVIHIDFIFIDLVFRSKDNILRLNPRYEDVSESNKLRIFSLKNKDVFLENIPLFINKEYVEIISFLLNTKKTMTGDYFFLGKNETLQKGSAIEMYFFDNTPNFGDLVGPWLATKLTGRPIINIKGQKYSKNAIFGVGSIIHSITENHQKCKIWGSGLITDVNLSKIMSNLKSANISEILSVRGKLTGDYLRKYGFSVPDIYGDPALIFSDLYGSKKIDMDSKKIIIPHYTHFNFFKSLSLQGYEIVDVRSGVTAVIDKIANADIVISTSMHGCILAQSYSIPWLHLHINDGLKLFGNKFKFGDFFTVLDARQVSQETISLQDLNQSSLDSFSKKVRVPRYAAFYNSNAIIEAFYRGIDDNCVEN